MQITKDKFVQIHYTLKDDEGDLIDSSVEKEPLCYIHGNNYLLPKLEAELEGKVAGDKFTAVLEAVDGYGERDEKMVASVPRENFDSSVPVEVGMQFQADTPYGPQIVKVIEVNETSVKVDANHELAGVRLHFDVEVIDVRDATEEEIASMSQGCSCGGCGGDCGGDCSCDGGCEGGCGGCGE